MYIYSECSSFNGEGGSTLYVDWTVGLTYIPLTVGRGYFSLTLYVEISSSLS